MHGARGASPAVAPDVRLLPLVVGDSGGIAVDIEVRICSGVPQRVGGGDKMPPFGVIRV